MSDETIPAVDDPERPASKEELLAMLEELRELWWQVEKDRRAAERTASEEAEQRALAELRAAHAAQNAPKRRRGPSDNLDPGIDV